MLLYILFLRYIFLHVDNINNNFPFISAKDIKLFMTAEKQSLQYCQLEKLNLFSIYSLIKVNINFFSVACHL